MKHPHRLTVLQTTTFILALGLTLGGGCKTPPSSSNSDLPSPSPEAQQQEPPEEPQPDSEQAQEKREQSLQLFQEKQTTAQALLQDFNTASQQALNEIQRQAWHQKITSEVQVLEETLAELADLKPASDELRAQLEATLEELKNIKSKLEQEEPKPSSQPEKPPVQNPQRLQQQQKVQALQESLNSFVDPEALQTSVVQAEAKLNQATASREQVKAQKTAVEQAVKEAQELLEKKEQELEALPGKVGHFKRIGSWFGVTQVPQAQIDLEVAIRTAKADLEEKKEALTAAEDSSSNAQGFEDRCLRALQAAQERLAAYEKNKTDPQQAR